MSNAKKKDMTRIEYTPATRAARLAKGRAERSPKGRAARIAAQEKERAERESARKRKQWYRSRSAANNKDKEN